MKGILILFLFILFSCGGRDIVKENEELHKQIKELKMLVKKAQEDQNKFRFLAEQIKGIKAVIETNYGEIELEFFPEKAPLHCFNFITRAESGFYDNTQFHRVIPNFMIQGGDPNTRTGNVATYGSGGPIIHIPHEFNDISHGPGILSMARTSNLNDGAGSQFFIMHGSSPQLDGQYTVFGRVTQGMDVVDKIAAVPRTDNDRPIKAVYIKRIKVFR